MTELTPLETKDLEIFLRAVARLKQCEFTEKEIADVSGISVRTLQRHIHEGICPSLNANLQITSAALASVILWKKLAEEKP